MIRNLTARILIGAAVALVLFYLIAAAWGPAAPWEFAVILLLCVAAAVATTIGLGRGTRPPVHH